MCAPYFVNLTNNTFQVKSLLFFVHLRSQQDKNRKSHLQLSNLQCCHFDIVILRVAIISNVQNEFLCFSTCQNARAQPSSLLCCLSCDLLTYLLLLQLLTGNYREALVECILMNEAADESVVKCC